MVKQSELRIDTILLLPKITDTDCKQVFLWAFNNEHLCACVVSVEHTVVCIFLDALHIPS